MSGARRTDILLLVIGLPAWSCVVAAGLGRLAAYAASPGEAGLAPRSWPSGSALAREPGRPTLVVLAHPRCPCTRATLHELRRVLGRAPGAPTWVVFSRPLSVDDDWARTDLWRTAEQTPGVKVRLDRGDVERDRFGGRTSGTALLYDAGGALVFAGGITGSRGHEGDNPGATAVLALLRGEAAETREAPVFGCSLVAPPWTSEGRSSGACDGCAR